MSSLSAAAQVFLLFQMITVLSLLIHLATGNVYPGPSYICLLNIGIISIAVLFAISYPYVGSILRYVGSVSDLIYTFTLPCTHGFFD